MSILFVDDEPMMTDVIKMMLPLYLDAEVITTNSPHEALEILAENPVTLLITDFFMPGMNGLELIRNVRGRQLSMPIIVLTGYYDSPELKLGNHTFGTLEIMGKPWSNAKLVERIKTLAAAA